MVSKATALEILVGSIIITSCLPTSAPTPPTPIVEKATPSPTPGNLIFPTDVPTARPSPEVPLPTPIPRIQPGSGGEYPMGLLDSNGDPIPDAVKQQQVAILAAMDANSGMFPTHPGDYSNEKYEYQVEGNGGDLTPNRRVKVDVVILNDPTLAPGTRIDVANDGTAFLVAPTRNSRDIIWDWRINNGEGGWAYFNAGGELGGYITPDGRWVDLAPVNEGYVDVGPIRVKSMPGYEDRLNFANLDPKIVENITTIHDMTCELLASNWQTPVDQAAAAWKLRVASGGDTVLHGLRVFKTADDGRILFDKTGKNMVTVDADCSKQWEVRIGIGHSSEQIRAYTTMGNNLASERVAVVNGAFVMDTNVQQNVIDLFNTRLTSLPNGQAGAEGAIAHSMMYLSLASFFGDSMETAMSGNDAVHANMVAQHAGDLVRYLNRLTGLTP